MHLAIDAIVVAGSSPNFVALAEEFPRLARMSPGKTAGYLFVASTSVKHVIAAWQAFAIEDQLAEEAIQRATVEGGRQDRRLQWNEFPWELRALMHPRPGLEANYATSIAETTKILGDPWDSWLGRLLAYKDEQGHVDVGLDWEQTWMTDHKRFIPAIGSWNGHELGRWCASSG